MAIFTKVSDDDFSKILLNYNLGDYENSKGILEGVENTNYFLNTSKGKYIFTIYESRTDLNNLAFFVNLMNYLHENNFPSPKVYADNSGRFIGEFKGKKFAIISLVKGSSIKQVNNKNLANSAEILAKFHNLNLQQNKLYRNNSLDYNFWKKTYLSYENIIDDRFKNLKSLMQNAFQIVANYYPKNLPSGTIHADYFPDNVMIDANDNVTGVIDYYMAANDFFAYEIAIMINAWCFDENFNFEAEKEKILIEKYNNIRKITEQEINSLPILKIAGCLRFLTTRLYDYFNVKNNSGVKIKNPTEYIKKLEFNLSNLKI